MIISISELTLLGQNVVNFRDRLEESLKLESPTYKNFLKENIDDIDKALEISKIPSYYKVAVVGRFKVGKSSFVNALTNSKLAGVSHNPETAAISVFRYSETTYAEIEVIGEDEWHKLREMYEETPDSIEVKRYSGFANFNKKHAEKGEKLNLADVEKQYIKSGGASYRIDAVKSDTKEGQKNFRKEIQKFTSSQSPLHYLVNQITIHAPIPLLGEKIELIDTPGLDDTEQFRVILTEEKVKDVDAILFLTASGASYGQSDKDFLIRQLRSRQIKQLQIIVTMIDVTYDKAKKQAQDDDEEIPTLESIKQIEKTRIRKEIALTLDELLLGQTKEEDAYYYMEQLESIPIHFVSTHYYDYGEHEKSGMLEVKAKLDEALSSSSRFEKSKKILMECSERVISRLKNSFETRLDAIDGSYNAEKVQGELQKIRKQLEKELSTFKKKLDEPLNEMAKEQSSYARHLPTYLDKVDMLARGIIESLKSNDVERHWRSKRAGNWGYIYGIGNTVADKIFPTVESILNEYIKHLNCYSDSIKIELTILQKQIQTIEETNQLSGIKPLSLVTCQENLVGRVINKDYVISCKDSIIKNLDKFAEDAYSKLAQTKKEVSGVHGSGTSSMQNTEVRIFYMQIQKILSETLRNNLEKRIESFAKSLLEQAENIKPKIERELMAEIDGRVEAIQSNLAFSNASEKEQVQQYLSAMISLCRDFDK